MGKWRARFVAKRLKGLADEHRSGVPRTVTDDHVEAVVLKTLTSKPADATHWSTRSMAKATGMSQPTVSRIWKAFGLKPWVDRHLQVVHRPVVHRQGPRHRRVVPEPAGAGGGGLRRREDRGAGPGPHPARAAVAAPHARAAHPRLRPPRHDRPVRGAEPGHRGGHPPAHRPPPGDRVQEVLGPHRPHRPPRPHGACRVGQLLHPQDPCHPTLAGPPPSLRVPLHADVELMDEPRRTMVRRAHHEVATTRHPPQRQRTRRVDHPMGRPLERRPPPLRLAQDRRRDLRQPRRILPTNLSTKASTSAPRAARRSGRAAPAP